MNEIIRRIRKALRRGNKCLHCFGLGRYQISMYESEKCIFCNGIGKMKK